MSEISDVFSVEKVKLEISVSWNSEILFVEDVSDDEDSTGLLVEIDSDRVLMKLVREDSDGLLVFWSVSVAFVVGLSSILFWIHCLGLLSLIIGYSLGHDVSFIQIFSPLYLSL